MTKKDEILLATEYAKLALSGDDGAAEALAEMEQDGVVVDPDIICG